VILVDTSIWIDYLGPRPSAISQPLDELLTANIPFALTPVILQEILQGTRTDREFDQLRRNLITQKFLFPIDPIETYTNAAKMYAKCRRAGVTPRSTIDCFIAQIAIEHNALLMHHDADYDRIAKVIPRLRIY
jgi:predicted nucleic acid-binding protein